MASDPLSANDFLYREALGEAQRLLDRDHPTALDAIESAARIAWFYHPGRFVDGALENPLLAAGRSLRGAADLSGSPVSATPRSSATTLHIATEVYPTGGHARILAAWLRRDLSTEHDLVLTRQRDPLPGFILDACRARDVETTLLDPDSSIVERARVLRSLASRASRVILHQNPDDATPIVALAPAGGPPVAMFNHAHFSFSMGGTVSDLIVNAVPYHREVTKRSRFPRETDLLPPGAFGMAHHHAVDKEAAKRRLGWPADEPVILTIGNEDYYRPAGEEDFFATAEKLLARRKGFSLVFVGIGPDSALVPEGLRANERVRLIGRVDDPNPFYQAADISLESFPTPSLGGLMESLVNGAAFPIPAYTPRESILRPGLTKRIQRTASEEEYLGEIVRRLDELEETRSLAERERQAFADGAERSSEYLQSLTERMAGLRHAPEPLPVTRCERGWDNVLLAENGRRDVGAHLGGLYLDAPWRAILSHARAMARGYESPVAAVRRIIWAVGRSGRRILGLSYGAIRRTVTNTRRQILRDELLGTSLE